MSAWIKKSTQDIFRFCGKGGPKIEPIRQEFERHVKEVNDRDQSELSVDEYRCHLVRYLTQKPREEALYQEFEQTYIELEELCNGGAHGESEQKQARKTKNVKDWVH
jgi:hypothetical protein